MCTIKPLGRRQSGLSLIELIIAIVVVVVGFAALLIPIYNVTKGSGNPEANKQAIAIAEAMLEEIELKPFNNSGISTPFGGPYTCANRPQFDAVFPDYNNYTSTGVCDMVTGAQVPGLGGYTTTVTLAPTQINGVIPAAQAYVITVTVSTSGAGAVNVSLTGLRTSYF
jgi:MSHA pilin protein MshD